MNVDSVTDNLLHAATTWLERVGATPDCVAVVQVLPIAAVGVHAPGQSRVGMLPNIDDAGADLCDAAAPWVDAAMQASSAAEAVAGALQRGARLRVLIVPAQQHASLAVEHAGIRVVVCASQVMPEVH